MVLGARNEELLKYLSLSKEATAVEVDAIDEVVTLAESFDSNWLEELKLRHAFDEACIHLEISAGKLKEQDELLANLERESEELMIARKRYGLDLANESQASLKNKSKLDDIVHQHFAFKSGSRLLQSELTGVPNALLSEQMRCAFNDLRRVNSGLEEKLVLTGVAKQRAMRELQSLLLDLRAHCSRNPFARFRQLVEDPLALDDPNLSPYAIKDINQVWKAAMPLVPSLSGDPVHTDLVTWLSISSGHFTEQCIRDLVDVLVTRRHKSGGGDASIAAEEEAAKLVGVLTAETHRYRSIAGALRSVIQDSRDAIEASAKLDSVTDVIGNACKVVRTRLGCRLVTFWMEGGVEVVGYSDGGPNTITPTITTFTLSPFISPLYSRSLKETCSIVGQPLNDEDVPADLRCLANAGLLDPHEEIDAFAVSSSSGGMTLVKGEHEFHSFSGIYCEQFYRRILSVIAPLQIAQVKRVASQRPIDLVDCLFELRQKAVSADVFASLVSAHLKILFRASFVAVLVPLDAGFMRQVPNTLLAMPSTVANCVKLNVPFAGAVPDDMLELGGGNFSNTTTLHIRPFSRGRSVGWVLLWTSSSSLLSVETCFNPDATAHVNALNTYASLAEQMMGAWVPTVYFADQEALVSFDLLDATETEAIRKVVRGGRG